MIKSSIVAATGYILHLREKNSEEPNAASAKQEGIDHINSLNGPDSEARIVALFLAYAMQEKKWLSEQEKGLYLSKITATSDDPLAQQSLECPVNRLNEQLLMLRMGTGSSKEDVMGLFEKLIEWLIFHGETDEEYGSSSITALFVADHLKELKLITEHDQRIMESRAYHVIRKSPTHQIGDSLRDYLAPYC